MPEKPSRTPHLHVRSVDGLLFEQAIAVTGNRTALLQLRAQIDRALKNPNASFPYEETIYHDVHGEPFEVVVKLARRREEMEEPVPRPERTPERLLWAELTRKSEERKERGGEQTEDR